MASELYVTQTSDAALPLQNQRLPKPLLLKPTQHQKPQMRQLKPQPKK